MNFRIGLSISKRLGQEGAKVIISSRKESNVQKTIDDLKKFDIDVDGAVCHVGKEEDRNKLIQFVSSFSDFTKDKNSNNFQILKKFSLNEGSR